MAVTSTVGGVTSGYCATGRLRSAIAPANVMTMDSTEAKIGRSMKKCEITRKALRRVLAGRGRLGIDKRWPAPVPVGGPFVHAGDAQQLLFLKGSGEDLQTNRQARLG